MNSLINKIIAAVILTGPSVFADVVSITNLPVKTDAEITALIIKERREKLYAELKTLGGRTKYHGKLVMQEIDDTNRLVKIERYADGTVYEIPFTRKKNKDQFKAKRKIMPKMKPSVLPGVDKARESNWRNRNTVSNLTVITEVGK